MSSQILKNMLILASRKNKKETMLEIKLIKNKKETIVKKLNLKKYPFGQILILMKILRT